MKERPINSSSNAISISRFNTSEEKDQRSPIYKATRLEAQILRNFEGLAKKNEIAAIQDNKNDTNNNSTREPTIVNNGSKNIVKEWIMSPLSDGPLNNISKSFYSQGPFDSLPGYIRVDK